MVFLMYNTLVKHMFSNKTKTISKIYQKYQKMPIKLTRESRKYITSVYTDN